MTILDRLAELKYRNNLLYRIGLVHLILFFLLLAPYLLDPREVLGINPWIKPMKFSISIGIYAWTIGWMMFDLPNSRRWIKALSILIGSSMLIEIAVILYQASRAVPSHFNTSTIFDSILFGIMGLMILANTIAVIVILVLYFLKKPRLDPAYLMAVRIGMVIFLVSSYIGKMMIDNKAHSIGGSDGGSGLPFVNWSTEFGDLRVAHFLGLHALQFIPLFAYFLKIRTGLTPKTRIYLTIIFAIGYAAIFSLLYSQAMRGDPLF
jgi:hypothetical protein